MYLPDGSLTIAHRFTLQRLAALYTGLLVVAALPDGAAVPSEVFDYADAAIVKNLNGYDFSAYAIGLRAIEQGSPGCAVFVLNDSVYGPFSDLNQEFATAPWDFTGYTGFSMIENHIQSYAFMLKRVDRTTLDALHSVFPENYAYDRYKDVVFQQETRLARVASRSMSVGARWFADYRTAADPSFFAALSLMETGFPFLKKSLLNRRPDIYDRDIIVAALENLGHPLP